MNKFGKLFVLVFVANLLLPNFIFAAEKDMREVSDDKLISMLDSALTKLRIPNTRIALRFSSTRVACSLIPPGTSWPVAGSRAICPAV